MSITPVPTPTPVANPLPSEVYGSYPTIIHVWNLRYPDVYRVPGLYAFGSTQGRRVVPGTYTARLSAGGEARSVEVEVLKDPRLDTPQSAYEAQDDLLREIVSEIEALRRSVVRLGDIRDQVKTILDGGVEAFNEAVREAGIEPVGRGRGGGTSSPGTDRAHR